MNRIYLLLCFCAIFLYSCKFPSKTTTSENGHDQVDPYEIKTIALASPVKNATYISGNNIVVKATLTDTSRIPDSILYLLDGKKLIFFKNYTDSFILNTDNLKLGYRKIDVVAYFPDSLRSYYNSSFFLKIKAKPQVFTYKVLNVFQHDINAYTQGLVYENGILYESTGGYKQSSLRKVDLKTGKVTQMINLPSDVFGEGISVFDGKIIQITWQEQIAFLYDKESFQLLNKFYYPIREGWGITYNGTNLIMSDGSSTLYFLDKNTFAEIDRVEVFDERGPVKQLNELEYINGEIWSNIYTTDTIIRINPKNGAVTGKIALNGLLKSTDILDNTDVLNGIAYDSVKGRLFVTGKNWPKLFEIAIFPQK